MRKAFELQSSPRVSGGCGYRLGSMLRLPLHTILHPFGLLLLETLDRIHCLSRLVPLSTGNASELGPHLSRPESATGPLRLWALPEAFPPENSRP